MHERRCPVQGGLKRYRKTSCAERLTVRCQTLGRPVRALERLYRAAAETVRVELLFR